MDSIFCGIDAGGTSCRAAVLSADGGVRGWGRASGANPNHAGWEGVTREVEAAVRAACSEAGILPGRIRHLFVGMAGVVSEADRHRASDLAQNWAPDCRVDADHDIRIALHGGLSGRPGVALIAGTGSSCYGRDYEGRTWQSGGWEALIDDLGSGSDLGRRGLAAAAQSADGRLPETVLRSRMFAALEASDVVEFSGHVQRPGMARHEMAALARIVMQAAEEGDGIAREILREGARELARMVRAVTARLFAAGPEIVLIGGTVEKGSAYRPMVESAIHEAVPGALIVPAAEWRPVAGAVALAATQVGHIFAPEILTAFSRSLPE